MTAPLLGLSQDTKETVRELLIRLVRAKHLLGFHYASWCVQSPSLEGNIALAGMAQEELGHAMVLEALLAEDLGEQVLGKEHVLTWEEWSELGRPSPGFSTIDGWSEMVVTCLATEHAVTATLEALKSSGYVRLAQRARKMLQEEEFHLTFLAETLRAFAPAAPETRQDLRAQYRRASDQAEARLGSIDLLTHLAQAALVPADAPAARRDFLHTADRTLRDLWA